MKTEVEVKDRIKAIQESKGDLLGFQQEALMAFFPEFWKSKANIPVVCDPFTEAGVRKAVTDYLTFAFGKAIDHRGISSSRSVEKLREWCWILFGEEDDLVVFLGDESNYAQYGVPMLKRIASRFDVKLPEEILAWKNGEMCSGCRAGEQSGCGE